MFLTGHFVGALLPTFLISRVLLWATRSWDGGVTRLIVVHIFSWLAVSLIAGIGGADGGTFAGAQVAVSYALPQITWFLFDVVWAKLSLRPETRKRWNRFGIAAALIVALVALWMVGR